MFLIDDYKKLDKRIENILNQPVEKISVEKAIPTSERLQDNNSCYSLEAAILFIDIRQSTKLQEKLAKEDMVKIYRAFMRMAVDCVRKNNGVTRQFLGDRIMGIFYNEKDGKGLIIRSAVDDAINCSRAMLTCIDYSLNKHFSEKIKDIKISCGIGIDYGNILIAKVGMLGVEHDVEKENEMGCVWVSKNTNISSKLADISNGNEILITENVFKNIIDNDLKKVWTKITRSRNGYNYSVYSNKSFYLNYHRDLDYKIKVIDNSVDESEKKLNDMIDKFKTIYENVIDKEKQLLTQIENSEKAEEEANNIKDLLKEESDILLSFIIDIFSGIWFDHNIIINIGANKIDDLVNSYFKVGIFQGIDKSTLEIKLSCYLVNIYNILQVYHLSFKYMLIMTKNESEHAWLNIEKETIKWARKNNKLYILSSAIRKKIDRMNDESRKKWIEYNEKIESIGVMNE